MGSDSPTARVSAATIAVAGRTPDRPPRPRAAGGVWRRLNAPQVVDGAALRAVCIALLAFYVLAAVGRATVGEPLGLWARVPLCVFIGLGVLLAPRFGWTALRAYTIGMVLMLNAATLAMVLRRGNQPAELAVLALALFAPTAFLQTAGDVLAVAAALGVGAVTFSVGWSPTGVTPVVTLTVLAGALGGGALTALMLIAFRVRLSESMTWWREVCARERALREFAEIVAPDVGEASLAHECARRLLAAFGPGSCTIVLAREAGPPCMVATAGRVPPAPDPDALSRLLAALADRRTLSCDPSAPGDLSWAIHDGPAVALPIALDGAVAGAVVLSAAVPRTFAMEDVLVWRAMAAHVGTALGSARLFGRLQAALRVRSEFVNTMSHELRSPLHVILGYAEMLGDEGADDRLAQTRIRACALEVLQLVENTLEVARIGSGRLALQPSDFDPRTVLEELREGSAALPEGERGLQVRWTVAGDLPVVHMDRLKLKEIVHNLLSNALKFTREGVVSVRAGCDGTHLRVEVADTGPGIPPEAQQRIYEMFERVEPSDGPRAGGVGLGLYIVRNLVTLMGGTIALESAPGCGSRFSVALPIRTEAPREARAPGA